MDAQLVFVEERPVTGRVLPIHTRMAIGREGCDVDLPDPEVSRHHATLEVHDGVAVLADAGSKNGTWVNDVRVVVPTELVAGDVVKFGNTVWHVQAARGDARARRPHPAPPAAAPRPDRVASAAMASGPVVLIGGEVAMPAQRLPGAEGVRVGYGADSHRRPTSG